MTYCVLYLEAARVEPNLILTDLWFAATNLII